MSEQSSKDIILNKTLRILTQQNELTPEEVAQLRLSHLHLAGKSPSISFTAEGSQEPKVVTLNLETHRALVGWLVNRPDSVGDFLFPGNGGEAMHPADILRAAAQAEVEGPNSEPAADSPKPTNLPEADLPRPEGPRMESASRPVRPLSRPEMGAPPPGVGATMTSFMPPPVGPEEDGSVNMPPTSVPKPPPPASRPPATASRPVSPVRPPSGSVSRPEPAPPPLSSAQSVPPSAAKAEGLEKTAKLNQPPAAGPKPEVKQEEAASDRPPEKPADKLVTPPAKEESKVGPPVAVKKDTPTAQQGLERKPAWPRFLIPGGVVVALLCVVCLAGGWFMGQSESGGGLWAALGWSGDSAQEAGDSPEGTEEAVVFESALPTPTLPPTSTPTSLPPTNTPPPTDTATPIPTDTPVATDTPAPTDTPTPTDTPEVEEAAPTPRPANTPTPGLKYPAPELVDPQDGFVFIEGNTLVLRWKPVNLAPNEQYAVRLVYRFQGQPAYQGSNVKEPEWTVPLALFGQIDGPDNRYEWFVVVERLNDDGSGTAVSPESQRRSFTWR